MQYGPTDRRVESRRNADGNQRVGRRPRSRRVRRAERRGRRVVRLERRRGQRDRRQCRPDTRTGRRGDLRDRRPHAQGLRPVLPRLFERDAVAGVPLSQRPRALRARRIRRLPARQRVARAQADQAARTRRRHLDSRLPSDPVRRSAAQRRHHESHRLFPAHSVSGAADPAQHSAARGTGEVAVVLRPAGFSDRHRRTRLPRLRRRATRAAR